MRFLPAFALTVAAAQAVLPVLEEAVVAGDGEIAELQGVRAVTADGHSFRLQGEGAP